MMTTFHMMPAGNELPLGVTMAGDEWEIGE
jgi:hypothetical protein